MTHWWRAYDEAVDDPKLILLSDRLHRAWFNLLCVASANGGSLPELAIVCIKLRMKPKAVSEILSELERRGLLDGIDGTLRPHNWGERQYTSDSRNAQRQRRYRERHRNVMHNAQPPPLRDVTRNSAREQITDTDTDPDVSSLRSETTRARARGSPTIGEMFDLFWQLYPNKVGKRDAFKAFEKAMKSNGGTLEKIMQGLHRYVQKTDDRPWCNPATWLNQGRWDDQPATVNGNGKSLLAACDRQLEQLGGRDAAARYEPGSEGPRSLDHGDGQADLELIPPR